MVVAEAAVGHAIEGGRGDRAAEGAGRTEAGVVGHDEQDVRRALGSRHRLGEVRLGFVGLASDDAAERRIRDRKDLRAARAAWLAPVPSLTQITQPERLRTPNRQAGGGGSSQRSLERQRTLKRRGWLSSDFDIVSSGSSNGPGTLDRTWDVICRLYSPATVKIAVHGSSERVKLWAAQFPVTP